MITAVEHRDNSAGLTFYAKEKQNNYHSEEETDFGLEINPKEPKQISANTTVSDIDLQWIRYRHISLLRSDKTVYEIRNKQIHQRVKECSRTIDLLEALTTGRQINNVLDKQFDCNEFKGLIDLDSIVAMGHSFGGATAIMCLGADQRYKLGVSLDPWMFPIKEESFDSITKPLLIINTDDKFLQRKPNLNKMLELFRNSEENTEDNREAININESIHLNQSDVVFLLNRLKLFFRMTSIFISRKGFSGYSNCDPFTVHDINNYLSLKFIFKHLGIYSIILFDSYLI